MAPFSEVAFVFQGAVPIQIHVALIALQIMVSGVLLPDGQEYRAASDGTDDVGSLTLDSWQAVQ